MAEFERLSAPWAAVFACTFPPQRFARFANATLLEKPNSRALLANLRHTPSPEDRQVVAWVDRHNTILGREALLATCP